MVDSLEGVTHALRTNEYRDRNPQYAWMLKALGLRVVHIWDFGCVGSTLLLLTRQPRQLCLHAALQAQAQGDGRGEGPRPRLGRSALPDGPRCASTSSSTLTAQASDAEA